MGRFLGNKLLSRALRNTQKHRDITTDSTQQRRVRFGVKLYIACLPVDALEMIHQTLLPLCCRPQREARRGKVFAPLVREQTTARPLARL